jgi:hypothetical protein
MLTLKMLNNGKFDIGGYFIYATDSPDKQLATIDLTQNQTIPNSRLQPYGVKFGSLLSKNSLGPGQKETEIYNLTGIGRIYSIEIVPIRWQTEKRKMMLISCKDARIKEEISCFVPCVDQPIETFCADVGIECGSRINNCRKQIDCGHCSGTDVCNSTGQCVPPNRCTETCGGFECGSVCTEICGNCNFIHSDGACSDHFCVIDTCDDNFGNCDGNGANGCETNLLTDANNCGYCGHDCGSESCVNGACTSSPSTCNGIWAAPENVDCDGGVGCTNCVCNSGLVSTNDGGCAPPGVSSCPAYCVWLGTYTTGVCRQNVAQCNAYCSGGTIQTGGNQWCVSPTTNCCCCP